MDYHKPVMLKECIEGLAIKENGIYVDVTFGGGGHSREILKKLKNGYLYAFDQDIDTHSNLSSQNKFKLINANFRHLKHFLRLEGVSKIDGLLADLGVSSHQIDEPKRGFSYRFDTKLDMRMNQRGSLTAFEVVNEYEESELADIFYLFGELRNSRRIASAIVQARSKKTIRTTKELAKIVVVFSPYNKQNQLLARVFQAVRIEVNQELEALKEMLLSAVDLLREEGRLAVISYHSLEDRIVKNLIKKGNFEGVSQKDFYGNPIKELKEVNKKILTASDHEVSQNPRSTSAKLRIASKL